jgi:tryptophan synthase alpha subunit
MTSKQPPLTNSVAHLWERFSSLIEDGRAARTVAVMPIVLTGYPNRDRYLSYIDLLGDIGIQFIEVVDPIPDGWATTTNETIRSAHRTALTHFQPDDGARAAVQFPASLKIVYPGSAGANLDAYMSACAGVYSVFQFAFPPSYPLPALSLPSTTMVAATDDPAALRRAAVAAKWMIVCKLSDRTGGALFAFERILDTLSLIRSETNVPLFCTFGISSAETVARLRSRGVCDGVIVGTPVLAALSRDEVKGLLKDLIAAGHD